LSQEKAAVYERSVYSGLIALAVLISFGILTLKTGLYCDDWSLLGRMVLSHETGLGGLIRAFGNSPFWYRRAGDLIYHPFLYYLFGLSATGYQIVFLLCDITTPILLFLALDRSSGSRQLSFLTALLFAVYPNHSSSHHWFAAVATAALPLLALSLERYSAYLEMESQAALAISVLAFAAATLTYEAVLPLAALHVFLDYLRRRDLKKSLKRCWPILAAAVFLVVYQNTIEGFFHEKSRRGLALDWGFALRVIGDGIECASTRILHLLWVYVPKAVFELPFKFWVVGGAPLLVLVLACLKTAPPKDARTPVALLWAGAGFLVTLACYAIFGLSAQHYAPQMFSDQNRLNAVPSIGSAMMLAALLSRLPKKTLNAALATILILFTVVNWRTGWDWKMAWDMESQVLSAMKPKLLALPGPAMISVEGAPHGVGPVPVFGGWSMDAAVQSITGRADLHAELPEEPMPGLAGAPRWVYKVKDGSLSPERP
jgi:hypothetical protein